MPDSFQSAPPLQGRTVLSMAQCMCLWQQTQRLKAQGRPEILRTQSAKVETSLHTFEFPYRLKWKSDFDNTCSNPFAILYCVSHGCASATRWMRQKGSSWVLLGSCLLMLPGAKAKLCCQQRGDASRFVGPWRFCSPKNGDTKYMVCFLCQTYFDVRHGSKWRMKVELVEQNGWTSIIFIPFPDYSRFKVTASPHHRAQHGRKEYLHQAAWIMCGSCGGKGWGNGHRMDLRRNAHFEVHRVDRLAESNGQLCAMQGSLGEKTKSLENQGQSIS